MKVYLSISEDENGDIDVKAQGTVKDLAALLLIGMTAHKVFNAAVTIAYKLYQNESFNNALKKDFNESIIEDNSTEYIH